MKKNTLFLATILFTSPLLAADGLTLREAKELVTQGPAARASQAMVGEAEAQATSADGMLYPMVNVSHGYSYSNDPVRVFSAKLQQRQFTAADFDIDTLNNPAAINHWQTRFEIVQPILHSVTDWRRRDAARFSHTAQEQQHDAQIDALKLQTSRLYYVAIALDTQSQIVEEGIERLQALEKSYEVMEAPTAATTTNYLIAQSVRLELTARKSALKSTTENVRRSLAALIGRSSESAIHLSDPLPPVPETTGGNAGSDERPPRSDLKAARIQVEAARSNLSAEKGTWWPNLDFVGGYNLYTGNYSTIDDAYDLNVFLTWPIFSAPRLGSVRTSEAQLKMVESRERALSNDVEAARRNAEESLSARIAEYHLVSQAEEKANQAITIARKRYAQGTLPLFDYSQSIQTWVGVRQQRVEAHRHVADALSQIAYERGTI